MNIRRNRSRQTLLAVLVLCASGIALNVPGWMRSVMVSRISDEILADPELLDINVDYPRKLGLSIVGTVPDDPALSRLKEIVNSYVDDPESVYWKVSVRDEEKWDTLP